MPARPDAELSSLDEAAEFLHDRGALTVTPCCSLPSLHTACHAEPYLPGGRGFAAYPRTKYVWGFQLAARPAVHVLKLHRGKNLLVTDDFPRLAGPLAKVDRLVAERRLQRKGDNVSAAAAESDPASRQPAR